jgi:hypothetical protein
MLSPIASMAAAVIKLPHNFTVFAVLISSPKSHMPSAPASLQSGSACLRMAGLPDNTNFILRMLAASGLPKTGAAK